MIEINLDVCLPASQDISSDQPEAQTELLSHPSALCPLIAVNSEIIIVDTLEE